MWFVFVIVLVRFVMLDLSGLGGDVVMVDLCWIRLVVLRVTMLEGMLMHVGLAGAAFVVDKVVVTRLRVRSLLTVAVVWLAKGAKRVVRLVTLRRTFWGRLGDFGLEACSVWEMLSETINIGDL